MRYRTVICVLFVGVVGVALGCSVFAPFSAVGRETDDTGETTTAFAAPPPYPHRGVQRMETSILESDLIVRLRLNSVETSVWDHADGTFFVYQKFDATVLEHLKGTSPFSIDVLRFDNLPYTQRSRAEQRTDGFHAERDAQWDDREAVVFLQLPAQEFQTDKRYVLGTGLNLPIIGKGEDWYSLHSSYRRVWLPAAAGQGSSPGDAQKFLTSLPPETQGGASGAIEAEPETVTLGEIKALIASVAAELAGGDDPAAMRQCVVNKYQYLRNKDYVLAQNSGEQYTRFETEHETQSGLTGNTVITNSVSRSVYGSGDTRPEGDSTFTGSVVPVLKFVFVPPESIDEDGDGTFDSVRFEERIETTRPLPSGVYNLVLNEPGFYQTCNFVMTSDWTLTVAPPDNVLHELFYDPVAIGNVVVADGTNGVLSPATFTDANVASATIGSISYESGTAKMTLSPHDGLAGHVLDIIELDGTVSLSMDVADATVDAANNTLSWSVSSAPWDDGDKLMVRIREALPSAPAPVDVAIDTTDSTDMGEPTETQAAVAEPRVESSSAPSVRPYISASSSGISRDPPTLEERILRADAIVRARFSLITPSSRSFHYRPFNETRHAPFVEFTFDVLESIKGSAAGTIVVEMQVKPSSLGRGEFSTTSYTDTGSEALAHSRDWIANDFDSSWNSREAILFLKTVTNASTYKTTGRSPSVGYVFPGPGSLDADAIVGDEISIASSVNKVWLPSKDETGSTAFLLDEPTGDDETTPSATLADLKTTITTTDALVDPNIEGHRECLVAKAREEREHDKVRLPDLQFERSAEIASGLPANTVVLEGGAASQHYSHYHLYGDDAEHFSWDVTDTDSDPNNGYTRNLTQDKPLPAGQYVFEIAKQFEFFIPCGHIPDTRGRWTISVVPPAHTLHELEFIPERSQGDLIASIDQNLGTLDPSEFTGADGETASIDRIALVTGDDGTQDVQITIDPPAAVDGQVFDIIELDGTVSLSMDVADATVDAANDTLSWSVSSAPWEDGDKLMVRIREAFE